MSMSNKINKIYHRLQQSKYTGDINHHHHFAVAIRNGKVVTPVSCNYARVYVFGKIRGSMHSEMSSLNYLMRGCVSHTKQLVRRKGFKGNPKPKGFEEASY